MYFLECQHCGYQNPVKEFLTFCAGCNKILDNYPGKWLKANEGKNMDDYYKVVCNNKTEEPLQEQKIKPTVIYSNELLNENIYVVRKHPPLIYRIIQISIIFIPLFIGEILFFTYGIFGLRFADVIFALFCEAIVAGLLFVVILIIYHSLKSPLYKTELLTYICNNSKKIVRIYKKKMTTTHFLTFIPVGTKEANSIVICTDDKIKYEVFFKKNIERSLSEIISNCPHAIIGYTKEIERKFAK